MGVRMDMKLDEYVKELIEGAVKKPEDVEKLFICYKGYYAQTKNALDNSKCSLDCRKKIIANLIILLVQFETVCAKAFSPLSGSQSTAKDIIKMFHGIEEGALLLDPNNE